MGQGLKPGRASPAKMEMEGNLPAPACHGQVLLLCVCKTGFSQKKGTHIQTDETHILSAMQCAMCVLASLLEASRSPNKPSQCAVCAVCAGEAGDPPDLPLGNLEGATRKRRC